jgi:trk system potassium uptake protein TrkA
MNVIIVGGGKTGAYLASVLIKNGCSVKVLESRKAVFEKVRKELPEKVVIHGDGSDPSVLEKTGIAAADVMVADTGKDEVNLVVSTISKFEFGVPKVIARVNNPKNAWMFGAGMGVDAAINQTGLISHLILEDIDMKNMMTLLKVGRGNDSIVQVYVHKTSPSVGKCIRDLAIPDHAVMIALIRGDESIIARGDTVIEAEDNVLALVSEAEEAAFNSLFN